MRWTLLVLLCASAFGQSNGFRAYMVQSNTSSAGVTKYLDNVTSGDLLYGCHNWRNTGETLTVSDTLGTTYTKTTQQVSTGGSGSAVNQCWYGIASSSGSNTVTVTGITVRHQTISEWSNISGTVDIAATASTTVQATTFLTTTPTTTINGDLCISWAGNANASTEFYSQQETAGGDGSTQGSIMVSSNVGLAGVQSLTITKNTIVNPFPAWNVTTECFLPSAATVLSSALPHGAQTTAYKATMLEAGLAGAETWSATGLPGWASLSSAGVITGTPNANGCSTVNFSVHDPGSVHTATRSLPLCSGASFATPSLVQHKSLTTGANTYTSSVSSGNLLIANIWGREASGALIWYPKSDGANNVLSDSLGTVWTRISPLTGIPGINGPNGAPMVTYAGCATSSGSDTVDFVVTTNTGSGPFHGNIAIEEWSGAQGVFDDGSLGNAAGGTLGGGISVTNANYNAQVANEVIHWMVARGQNTAPTLGGSFTTIDSTVISTIDMGTAYYVPGAAGSYGATDTESGVGGGPNSGDVLTSELFALRPEISGLACGGTPVTTTAVPHRVREY